MSDNQKQVTDIKRSIRRLDSFRIGCLVGEGPASIEVDGYRFRDELEAEGYLVELSAALKEIQEGAT
jgi:hypothetical protein